ncbi:MAG: cytochrome C [Campylobacterota bacterium]|nr:cytochrome C [Campylobacterota bacterium]
MKTLLKTVLASAVLLAMSATVASADVNKGKKLYMKKLKKHCGISGAAMAGKHTQDEWSEIQGGGKMADEIKLICPKVKDGAIKDKYLEHYYDFFKEYGSDSGNVPSC